MVHSRTVRPVGTVGLSSNSAIVLHELDACGTSGVAPRLHPEERPSANLPKYVSSSYENKLNSERKIVLIMLLKR